MGQGEGQKELGPRIMGKKKGFGIFVPCIFVSGPVHHRLPGHAGCWAPGKFVSHLAGSA